MPRLSVAALALLIALLLLLARAQPAGPPAEALFVGFAEKDITPKLAEKTPVYMAGFGTNRAATGVRDPLFVRAVVLKHGARKVALVSADLVGLFRDTAQRVRAQLPGFAHVVVSSTHNHEGPDTLGLWGPSPLQSGLDRKYLALVESRIVEAVRDADGHAVEATARIGKVKAPELLEDNREPYVKHDELVVLAFNDAKSGKEAGLILQWNCHPETLGSKNTLLSSDFVGPAVSALARGHRCPVAYFTGTVGGLMTSLGVPVQSADGKELRDGTFEKTQRYGELLAAAAERALRGSRPLQLTPFQIRARVLDLPMKNKRYLVAQQLGVLDREAYLWPGKSEKVDPKPIKSIEPGKESAIRTEIAYLRFGELEVATVPGEIYPELVLGKVQDPADPGADFPDAPVEPALYAQMRGPHRMLIGLAGDEIGYIIPKRQWDEKPPFCYGRKKAQYGEQNSLGPDTAPLMCRAFAELVRGVK